MFRFKEKAVFESYRYTSTVFSTVTLITIFTIESFGIVILLHDCPKLLYFDVVVATKITKAFSYKLIKNCSIKANAPVHPISVMEVLVF